MKEILLTKGYVALVDDEDYDYLNQFRWHVEERRESCIYAVRNTYKREGFSKRGAVKMHREIMHTPIDMEVDHVDHNGLNNQKSNLRNCTARQNGSNKGAYGQSLFKGIYSRVKKGITHYYANIRHGDKLVYLGLFYDIKEAAMAYDKKAIELHGEFACLNFLEKKSEYLSENP